MIDLPLVDGRAGQIRLGERLAVTFHRTLRVPLDGRRYPLPAGLGTLPIVAVDDLELRPAGFDAGDAIVPLHVHEALWIGIHAAAWKPNVLKVAVGGINAVSGLPERGGLSAVPQDYLVCPPQLWLDGVNTGSETVRQFVATPTGSGRSVESALTGRDEVGGLTLTAIEPVPGVFPDRPPEPARRNVAEQVRSFGRRPQRMAVAAGGEIRQKIYPDEHGSSTWDLATAASVTVRLVEAHDYAALAGCPVPETPISRATYDELGMPWFELADEQKGDVPAPAELRDLPRSENLKHEPQGGAG